MYQLRKIIPTIVEYRKILISQSQAINSLVYFLKYKMYIVPCKKRKILLAEKFNLIEIKLQFNNSSQYVLSSFYIFISSIWHWQISTYHIKHCISIYFLIYTINDLFWKSVISKCCLCFDYIRGRQLNVWNLYRAMMWSEYGASICSRLSHLSSED